MRNNYIFVLYMYCIVWCACENEIKKDAQKTLAQAETNRAQLDSVINYFKQQPENKIKLHAAYYLIANMSRHSTYQGSQLSAYCQSLHETPKPIPRKTLSAFWEKAKKEYKEPPSKIKDSKILTASYLIRHIEGAFNSWQTAPWKDEIDFEDFCRYILPYRICDEVISEYWIDSLRNQYAHYIKGITNVKQAFEVLHKQLGNEFRSAKASCPYTIDVITLNNIKTGGCKEDCIWRGAICRALGIPVAYDYINCWSNYSQLGHSWLSLVLKNKTYTIEDSIAHLYAPIPESVFKLENKVENNYLYQIDTLKQVYKIYRKQFDVKEEYDVSLCYNINGYFEMEIPEKTDSVHLCIFRTGEDWLPVCSTKVKHNKCRFENLGTKTVYLLIQDGNGTDINPVTYPFILHSNGNIEKFIPDRQKTEIVTLYRKYPLFAHWHNQYHKMTGGKIEASNNADFSSSITLDSIEHTPTFENKLTGNSKTPFQYIRYVCPTNCRTPIAELVIYDLNGNIIKGEPIGSEFLSETSINNPFDGNYRTVSSTKKSYWVGLKFSKKQYIGKIVLYPKNDGNFIEPGNHYELFYYQDQWISLGEKTATTHSIQYEVPKGSLLLLRNNDRGKEERIFIYRNDKQYWF